jgi:nicotinamide-nucleotide amidase
MSETKLPRLFGEDDLALAGRIIARAQAAGETIALVESCTGGLIGALFTAIPGASRVFECGFVVYGHRSKERLLGVPTDLLMRHGSVSQEAADALALAALSRSGATIALAVTGIAGPDGGTETKPAGMHFIACARSGAIASRRLPGPWPDPALGRDGMRFAFLHNALRVLDGLVNSLD